MLTKAGADGSEGIPQGIIFLVSDGPVGSEGESQGGAGLGFRGSSGEAVHDAPKAASFRRAGKGVF